MFTLSASLLLYNLIFIMSSKIAAVVAYPSKNPDSGEPIRFDMSYYLATHMKIIEEEWSPYGLKGWSINEFPNPCPLTSQAPPYAVQTTCYFDTVDNMKTALEKGAAKTTPDITKFTNVAPVLWVGEKGAAKTL